MPASMFLPEDVESAAQALIAATIPNVSTGSIGDLEINDNGQLIFDPPCIRSRYANTEYNAAEDNRALAYNAAHILELWISAENLRSKEAQRNDTLALLSSLLPQMAGARLVLPDTSLSEPVQLVSIRGMDDDPFGMIYVVSISVAGIAQFPGTNF